MPESATESVPSNLLWDVLRYIIVAIVSGILIWYCFFYTPTNYVSREHLGDTMGTKYSVKVAQFPENADWQKVAAEIQGRLDTLDQMMSTYKPDSEVCRFNASASVDDWFPVSQETASIVQTSLTISQLTEGAFDITVAPLVRHWGFGAGSRSRQALSFEELKSAAVLLKEQTGYEKLSVRLEPPALQKSIPELTIDLSAIAKGFAADSIAELLEEHKIADYMIEVGGEVRSKGKKDKNKNKDWIVGIEKPTPEFSGHQQTLVLGGRSLATSGSYVQAAEIGGQRISHIIDPRSGLPSQTARGANELVSAAVIAPSCTVADAWATAMFVLGERKGVELAQQHSIAVLFLLQSGNGIVEVPSKHWGK